jgi:acyl-CoA reductase-like NAD-dependent aldehyde dehydrogenase
VSAEGIERRDPATGDPIGTMPVAGPEEVAAAVAAARTAFSEWADTAAQERAELLCEAADRLEALTDELAAKTTAEMGKPLADAAGGVDAAISTARQYAALGPLHRGRALQGAAGSTDLMQRVPRGVAACIVPWNDPVAIAVQGVAANLAVGNTVVCKPSPRAPFSVASAMSCFDHFPPGVVNLLHGDDRTGQLLVEGDVDVVVFTGSVAAGRWIAQSCAGRFVHTVLELGGNDPLVVDRDVDPVWAAEQAATGAFANAGQICVAVERIYCHAEIVEPFVDALVRRATGLRMGDGRRDDTELGPLVDLAHREQVHEHVLDAVESGARVRCGGEVPAGPGAFYPATVLTDVPAGARVLTEETFGPVVPVVSVASFEEGLELAAAGDHGLAATVLTGSQAHAQEAWRALPVGTVKVNAVFGGAPGGAAHPHGVSGNSLGYGPELLDELTRYRVVHLEPGRTAHTS